MLETPTSTEGSVDVGGAVARTDEAAVHLSSSRGSSRGSGSSGGRGDMVLLVEPA